MSRSTETKRVCAHVLALGLGACASTLAAQSARVVDVVPRELAIGDALTLRIRVEHAPSQSVTLTNLGESLGLGWAELEQHVRRLPSEAGATSKGASTSPAPRVASEVELVLTPLEIGKQELPQLRIELSDVTGAGGGSAADPIRLSVALEPQPTSVQVAAALGEGEDAPRELRPLRDVDAVEDAVFAPAWIAGGCALLVAGAVAALLVVRAARARERVRTRVPTCEERFATLESRARELAAAPFAHELAQLLRQSVGELCPALRVKRGAAMRAALTDEEYVDSLDPLAPERERLAALLVRMQAVRYGGAEPTAWARDEWLAEAKELLGALRARGMQTQPARELLDAEAVA